MAPPPRRHNAADYGGATPAARQAKAIRLGYQMAPSRWLFPPYLPLLSLLSLLSVLPWNFSTTAAHTLTVFEAIQKGGGGTGAHRRAKARTRSIWLFTQYLLSLLAGNPPPPTPAQTERPRLILLPDNALGAKCLDGSPPGYYFRPGTGAGKSMWHIYLPGGAWCGSAADCVARSKTLLGSSTFFTNDPTSEVIHPGFTGMLSSNSTDNPPFYSWNLVRPIYCDGGGFAGTTGRAGRGEWHGAAPEWVEDHARYYGRSKSKSRDKIRSADPPLGQLSGRPRCHISL
ncbi:hypothetical protein CLOM_g8356 [Closterium sp. NIES-68]|nr:hypothetical protein CLOM_g8356 [Closterium sp. NIES-68]